MTNAIPGEGNRRKTQIENNYRFHLDSIAREIEILLD